MVAQAYSIYRIIMAELDEYLDFAVQLAKKVRRILQEIHAQV
jgi:hypothetical protein